MLADKILETLDGWKKEHKNGQDVGNDWRYHEARPGLNAHVLTHPKHGEVHFGKGGRSIVSKLVRKGLIDDAIDHIKDSYSKR